MRLLPKAKIVTAEEVKPGDLLLSSSAEFELAIATVVSETNIRSIALSRVPSNTAFIKNLDDFEFVSFGKDWIVEPLETVVTDEPNGAGEMRLTSEGLELGLQRYMGKEVWVNLDTLKASNINAEIRRIVSWRLWASESHRMTPNAIPLYEKAPSAKPSSGIQKIVT